MEIKIGDFDGIGYQVVLPSEQWKIGITHFTERFDRNQEVVMERHMTSDEAFVLLAGNCTVITAGEEEHPIGWKEIEIEPGRVYCVPLKVWHHIWVSEDAKVLVVENSEVSKENTQKERVERM